MHSGIVCDKYLAGSFECFELGFGRRLGKLGLRIWLQASSNLFELGLGCFGSGCERGELVVGGFEGGVDKDGAVLGAMLTREWERNEVAEAAALAGQCVLRREEAIEAGEELFRTGLGEQTGSYGTREGSRDRLAEEDPHVSTRAGTRDFDEWVEAVLTAGFGIQAGSGTEVGVVEIAGEEEAGVALAQRVEPNVEVVVEAEMLLENLRGERLQVWVVAVVTTVGCRRPALLFAVVSCGGVHVLAAAEVVGEQAQLCVGGGGVGDCGEVFGCWCM